MTIQRFTCAMLLGLGIAVASPPANADHTDPGEFDLLLQAMVMPDFVLDGRTFGNGMEALPALQEGVIGTNAFASYSEQAGNTVHLQVGLWGREETTGDPIVATDAIIVISDFPDGTEFPNAHAFIDLDGDPATPDNPIYWYGTVKRTETIDNYRLIQVRRPDAEPFLLSYEVFGTLE